MDAAYSGLQELHAAGGAALEGVEFAAGASPPAPPAPPLLLSATGPAGEAEEHDAGAAHAPADLPGRRVRSRGRSGSAAPPLAADRPQRVRAPPPPPPSTEALAPRPPALRCLDTSHKRSCTRCTAAPALCDAQDWILLGQPGKKNGEKLLRSMLVHTPEWADPDHRAKMAASCSANGRLETITQVFNGALNCSALRKVHVLHLARSWGYRSDVWCRKALRPAPAPWGSMRGAKRARGGAQGRSSGGGGGAATDDSADDEEEAEEAAAAGGAGPADERRRPGGGRPTPPLPPSPPEADGAAGVAAGGVREPPPPRSAGLLRAMPREAALTLPLAAALSPAGAAAAHALAVARVAPGAAAAAAAAAAGARAAMPPPPPRALAMHAPAQALLAPPARADEIVSYAVQRLRPLSSAAGVILGGAAAHAIAAAAIADADAAVAAGLHFITPRTLAEARAAAAGWRGMYDDMTATLGPQRQWTAALCGTGDGGCGGGDSDASPDVAGTRSRGARAGASRGHGSSGSSCGEGGNSGVAAAVAWSHLSGRELPMEGLTRQMLTLVGASASYGHIRADDARRNGGMTALESAWLDELAQAHALLMEIGTHAQVLLGQLKLARMSVFLTGATALLEALTATASAAAEGWMTRVTWLESFLQERAERMAMPVSSASVARLASSAARPQLLLAFGGASYSKLLFHDASGPNDAAGGTGTSDDPPASD